MVEKRKLFQSCLYFNCSSCTIILVWIWRRFLSFNIVFKEKKQATSKSNKKGDGKRFSIGIYNKFGPGFELEMLVGHMRFMTVTLPQRQPGLRNQLFGSFRRCLVAKKTCMEKTT